MARNFDDAAARRIRDADGLAHARRRDAEERIDVVTTNLVVDAQEKLARRLRLDRIWRAGAVEIRACGDCGPQIETEPHFTTPPGDSTPSSDRPSMR
ncbi:hypothetical protein [Streptomyces sp. NRRL S-1824]|uniref:hypothetical protein n=1 Tax=Streptomyces sp. NRRL S-1824 TaxID=1463889 RepID=UPI0004C90849|nr:hypothetical protein [Streptomyces sp. NRRL S-1824]